MTTSFRVIAIAFPLVTGCLQRQGDLDADFVYQGPGSEAWGDEDVSCASDGDCLAGEACQDSVCQIDKCSTGLNESNSPHWHGPDPAQQQRHWYRGCYELRRALLHRRIFGAQRYPL